MNKVGPEGTQEKLSNSTKIKSLVKNDNRKEAEAILKKWKAPVKKPEVVADQKTNNTKVEQPKKEQELIKKSNTTANATAAPKELAKQPKKENVTEPDSAPYWNKVKVAEPSQQQSVKLNTTLAKPAEKKPEMEQKKPVEKPKEAPKPAAKTEVKT